MAALLKIFLSGLLIFLFLGISATAQTDTLRITNLNKKAFDLKFSDPDSAKMLLDESLELSEEMNFRSGTAEALKIKGILAHIKGDLDQAAEFAQQAIEIYSELNNNTGRASCLNLVGVINYSRGKYAEALSYYIEVLKIYESIGDSANIAKIYNNIGNTYYRQQEDAKALTFYERSNAVYSRLGNKSGQMDAVNNIAMVLMEQKKYQEALSNYRQAEQFARETNNKKLLASIYQNMAICFRYQNDISRAKEYYERSYSLKLELDDADGICSSLTGLAIVARQSGDPKKAIALGNKVLETSLKAGLLDRTNGAYEIIYQSYESLKDFPNAYKYRTHFTTTKDSLFNLEKTKQISEIQTKYETEKKEQQILLLTKEAEVQAAIKNRAILVASLLVVVLLLGAYGYRLKTQNAKIRNEKLQAENRLKEEENLRLAEELKAETEFNRIQAEKHQLEIDYKNREMTSAALYVVQRNEILSDLKEKMTTLVEDKTIKESIKPLLKLIDSNLDLDNDWDKLKMHFDQVHPGFFERLKTEYPELTQTELKHIAYMKINLASKEIARLLNIGLKAIQMSRYRIKKKMNLPEEVNLIDFINNF
jgi:tetratricopeptide (TPR) repeat protein